MHQSSMLRSLLCVYLTLATGIAQRLQLPRTQGRKQTGQAAQDRIHTEQTPLTRAQYQSIKEPGFDGYSRQEYQTEEQYYQHPQQYQEDGPYYQEVLSYKEQEQEDVPKQFAYQYGGTDSQGLQASKIETQSDDGVVTGQYKVELPDGRTQIVSYRADPVNGYQADVRYEGVARPEEPEESRPVRQYPRHTKQPYRRF